MRTAQQSLKLSQGVFVRVLIEPFDQRVSGGGRLVAAVLWPSYSRFSPLQSLAFTTT
jgi:hypothetical protein